MQRCANARAPKTAFLRGYLYADDRRGVNEFFKVGNLRIF